VNSDATPAIHGFDGSDTIIVIVWRQQQMGSPVADDEPDGWFCQGPSVFAIEEVGGLDHFRRNFYHVGLLDRTRRQG
jgi:hypothetical protein